MGLRPGERERWDRMAQRLRVPFHADGVISQFEGYEQLAEFDWEAYRARYGDIGRLDLILAAEGDSPNNYRLSKQADVLMLFYLFSAEELRGLLESMGYSLPPDSHSTHRRLLPRPHQQRLDPEPSGALLGACPQRPAPVVVAVHPGAGQRPRRHPGRHHPRRRSPRRHGRHRRPDPALLRRPGDPRRRTAAASEPPTRASPRGLRHRLPRPADQCRADPRRRSAFGYTRTPATRSPCASRTS